MTATTDFDTFDVMIRKLYGPLHRARLQPMTFKVEELETWWVCPDHHVFEGAGANEKCAYDYCKKKAAPLKSYPEAISRIVLGEFNYLDERTVAKLIAEYGWDRWRR